MENNLICPICGEPTNVYMGNARKDRLCRKHGTMLKNGEIITDEKGTFIDPKTNTVLNADFYKDSKSEKSTKQTSDCSELTCIICGQESNGKHFCHDCWNKYKDKSIDIRISNCRDTQIIDEYGNKKITCKDGRKVRSRAEKIIMDYFFDNYIRVIYERKIPYTNEKGEEKELHPDFYLKDYDLYIEFNGLTNKSYLNVKNYANKIYQEKGLKVEVLESDDIDDVETTMEKLLSKYQKK